MTQKLRLLRGTEAKADEYALNLVKTNEALKVELRKGL